MEGSRLKRKLALAKRPRDRVVLNHQLSFHQAKARQLDLTLRTEVTRAIRDMRPKRETVAVSLSLSVCVSLCLDVA